MLPAALGGDELAAQLTAAWCRSLPHRPPWAEVADTRAEAAALRAEELAGPHEGRSRRAARALSDEPVEEHTWRAADRMGAVDRDEL